MSLSFDIRAIREASEAIKKQQEALAKTVLDVKIEDYASYMERRGRYWGLKDALDILEDVEKRLSK